MDQIERQFNHDDIAFVDCSKFTEDELQKYIKTNYEIRKESVQYQLMRSFDLEDLEDDIYSQVDETWCIKYNKDRIEVDPNDYDQVFNFDRDDMSKIDYDAGKLYSCVVFGKDVDMWIIYYPDDLDKQMQDKLDEYGIPYSRDDDTISYLIGELEDTNISVRDASKDQIVKLLEEYNI